MELSASRQRMWAEFPVGNKGNMGYAQKPQPLLWSDIKAYSEMVAIPKWRLRNWISWVQELDMLYLSESARDEKQNLKEKDKEVL